MATKGYADLEKAAAPPRGVPPHVKLQAARGLRTLYFSGWLAVLVLTGALVAVLSSLPHTEADTARRAQTYSKGVLAFDLVSLFMFGGMMTFLPSTVAGLQQGPNLYPGVEPTGPIVVKFITYTGSYVLLIGLINAYCLYAGMVLFGLVINCGALCVDGVNLFIMASYRRQYEDEVSNLALLQNVGSVLSVLLLTLSGIVAATV